MDEGDCPVLGSSHSVREKKEINTVSLPSLPQNLAMLWVEEVGPGEHGNATSSTLSCFSRGFCAYLCVRILCSPVYLFAPHCTGLTMG